MSHIKFRRELVMALVGDFRQGGGASTRGRTSMSGNELRLNGMLHVIIPHPEKITQRFHSVLQTKCARWKEGNNIHL
jgi:hypothetical protein